MLPAIHIGDALRQGAVTIVPLFARTLAPALPRCEPALDALAAGALEVRELANPVVHSLEARNRGARSVLLLDGDHLSGARQNRMVVASLVVRGRGRATVPVACVEQQRWRGARDFAADATASSARLRQLARATVTASVVGNGPRVADQHRIWNHIAVQQASRGVASATRAMSHTFQASRAAISALAEPLAYPADAIGVALGIDDGLISVDVFEHPATCARYWRRLVEGVAFAAVADEPGAALRGEPRLRDAIALDELPGVLDELAAARWTPPRAAGDGQEQRALTPRAAGTALLLDGALLHFGVAPHAPREATHRGVSSSPMRALPERLAQRYELVGELGRGATKRVYRARDRQGGPDVAIARVYCSDARAFEAEVALARRVDTAYAPQIFDATTAYDDDDHLEGWVVMERCEGPNLAELAAEGALALDRAAPILLAFARALRAVHDAHVLHRDVKLENAMLTTGPAGRVLKLVDFGLSSRAASATTAVGAILHLAGTFPYMARELVRGEPLDARSDVYAFAVCAYRLLVGSFPVMPQPEDSELAYLSRLRDVVVDPTPLPATLPSEARAMLARMLSPARDARPFMPEVVAAFERAFAGAAALPTPAARVARPVALTLAWQLAHDIASPEHVLVAACPRQPFVVLAPGGGTTQIRALDARGELRWWREVEGALTTGVRADLDGDQLRELYLAGRDRVVALDPAGDVRFARPRLPRATSSMLAIADRGIAVDGELFDPTGEPRGPLPHAYRGDGRQLIVARDPSGVAYHGRAGQAFCGDLATAAAIVADPHDAQFLVAQLEHGEAGRVQLAIYGPGGARHQRWTVAEPTIDTGDLAAISHVYARPAPFAAHHAPLALLGRRGTAVVIVPLLDPPREARVPATLAAFELPSGRPLWRRRPAVAGPARAVLAELQGDHAVQLVVGDGQTLTIYDPWTGDVTAQLPCVGVPIAVGDPRGTGHVHIVTAARDHLALWRGPRCAPHAMTWTGGRGDLWRTGCARRDGRPFGPI